MIIQQLTPELAERAWPLLEPYVAQLTDRFPDDWPKGHFEQEVTGGYVTPWLIWDEVNKVTFGLVVTEIVTKPSGRKAIRTQAAGHDHKEWVGIVRDMIDEQGKAHGCTLSEIIGREGWQRSLPGYRRDRFALFSKELG